MTFRQLLRILAARKFLAGMIFSSVMVLTLAFSLLLPKSYKATATIVADIKPDPISGFAALGTQTSYLSTQADIIQSNAVAARVIKSLRIDEMPIMREKWMNETNGKGDYQAWLSEMIGLGLVVKPARDSSVLEINYKSVSPTFAAALANAYAKAYIDSVIQMKVDPARNYANFFEERATLAREKLEKAQARLAEAQREKGIVVTDERLDGETARLNELGGQLVMSRVQIADTSSRSGQAQAKGEILQEVLNNPLIAGLKSDLARQQNKLMELDERLGSNHPQLIELKASIADMEKRLRAEINRVQASAGVNNTIAVTRSASVQSAYDEQRAKVLRLKEARSELAVLEQEVVSAQRLYDAIQVKLSQVNLESNSSQSNIYMLSSATEPAAPSSPKPLLNMVIAFFPAVLLAVLGCMGVEGQDRRLRGPYDLQPLADIPVIGIMPSPNQGQRVGWVSRITHNRLPRNSLPGIAAP